MNPPKISKEDWRIVRALSEELAMPLPYDNEEQLRARIAQIAPHLLKLDHVEAFGFEKECLTRDCILPMDDWPIYDMVDVSG